MSNFTAGMNDLLRPLMGSRTDSKNRVSESILSINAILPKEKVTFLFIKFCKRYLLLPLLAKSGFHYGLRKMRENIWTALPFPHDMHEDSEICSQRVEIAFLSIHP